MQWDPGSGQYNMGFRNYDPGLGSFDSRDMYNGSSADMALTSDPFSGGAYAFGDANPISNIELDGHCWSGFGFICSTVHAIEAIDGGEVSGRLSIVDGIINFPAEWGQHVDRIQSEAPLPCRPFRRIH